jgi:hypothetical protein
LKQWLDGRRVYEEAILLDGLRDGWTRHWNERGRLSLVEPYSKGRLNGLVEQLDDEGRCIGAYRIARGTGWTFWWDDEPWHLAEVGRQRSGRPDGPQWCLDASGAPFEERCMRRGVDHGITRRWQRGRLVEKIHFLDGAEMDARTYARAASGGVVPPDLADDDAPARRWPAAVKRMMTREGALAACASRLGAVMHDRQTGVCAGAGRRRRPAESM